MTDTIAAIATPPGVGGVGIIRVSGPQAKKIGEALCQKEPTHQKAIYCKFLSEDYQVLDFGYLLYFKAPHSFTGEDTIELQGHGGPVVMDMVLKRVLSLGARPAEAGEFSKQAFLNDKIDLIQAEAVADLIQSSSETSVKLAQRSLTGVFSKAVKQLSDKIIHLRMYVEAALDFPEEEIDFISDAKVVNQLESLFSSLKDVLTKASQGAVVREGLQIVIVGRPNAGKSTLINQLSGEETAIVTAIPGTTRDILREKILINGVPVQVVDTAGLRDSEDIVEQEGVRRAKQAMAGADLIILLTDIEHQLDHQLTDMIDKLQVKTPVLKVFNKIDIHQQASRIETDSLYISAKEGLGIDMLKDEILSRAGYKQQEAQGSYLARRRHLNALEQCLDYLNIGLQNLSKHNAGELLAEDLKQAHAALGEITGEFSPDDLLGKIFSSFCIGK